MSGGETGIGSQKRFRAHDTRFTLRPSDLKKIEQIPIEEIGSGIHTLGSVIHSLVPHARRCFSYRVPHQMQH